MKKWIILGMIGLLIVVAFCSSDSGKNLKLAYSAAKKQDWQGVLTYSGKRLDQVPTDSDAALLKALALFHLEYQNQESLAQALNLVRQALSEKPERYDIHLVYGWMLLNIGRSKEALAPLEKAYELHLKSAKETIIGQEVQGTIKFALAKCCVQNRLYDKAYHYYCQAVQSMPYAQWPSVQADLGALALFRGKYVEAMAYTQRALALADAMNKANEANRTEGSAATGAYPYMATLYVNTAVLCDYLSWRAYNKESYASYRAVVGTWYDCAKRYLEQEKRFSRNAQQQMAYNKQIQALEKRRAVFAVK